MGKGQDAPQRITGAARAELCEIDELLGGWAGKGRNTAEPCEVSGKSQANPRLKVSERYSNKKAFWKHLEEIQVYQLSWLY